MRSKLAELHRRLKRLKRRRQRIRWGTAWAAVAIGVLWVLAGAFLIDWLFEMNVVQRSVALALYAGILIWLFQRYALPWLGQRESELDVALLIERQQHIDTDLTAAVQFEWPEAPEWGSVELEQAVIEQVSVTTPRLDVSQPVPRQYLSRRMSLLLATVAVWAAVAYLYPYHVQTFFRRLVLGSEHYPTRTVIKSIVVNGKKVDPQWPASTRISARYGDKLSFQVECDGEIPEEGHVRLKAPQSGLRTEVELKKSAEGSATFGGELPKLFETVRYQIYVGDAWTDPARLAVTALPNIDVELEVVPPQYDESEPPQPAIAPANLRQVSVLEGSRVAIRVRSDKTLQNAVCKIGEQEYALAHAPEQEPGEGKSSATDASEKQDRWLLASDGTPLVDLMEPVRYEIQVTDEEEEQLEQPFQGVIRVQADGLPRVAAAVVTRYVLPMAKPRVYYRALDDHGLATLSLVCEISGAGGTREKEVPVYTRTKGKRPERTLDSAYRLDLSPLELKKGDQVKVALKAVDFRGRREGKSSLSEPFIFQVTDEEGVLAAMTETDRQSAERLDLMIQRQLGIGETQ